jgi:putative toxin-antitoxin system antitoxin component (TIGR02293 family)
VDRLQVELGTAQAVVLKLTHISPATLTRRRASAARQRVARTAASKPAAAKESRKTPAPARLSPEESDRIYRVASIIDSADQLFEGDHEAALRWLKEPSRALGGVTPLDCLETEAGTEMVRDLIGRLEYGVIT